MLHMTVFYHPENLFMTGLGFIIVVAVSCILSPCEGQIIPPPGGNSLIGLNGSTVRIEWSLNSGLPAANIRSRSWVFRNSRGDPDEFLGDISRTGVVDVSTKLYEVDIEKPATLILKNVNASYNGTYEFSLLSPGASVDEVVLFIAARPSVMINCSHPTTENENNDLTCVCKSEGGNPPANVTWYDKHDTQIGNARHGENILTLTKVTKQSSGIYTCKAQSYTLVTEKAIEVEVRHKPIKTNITVPEKAYLGQKLNIACDSDGLPAPSFTITHNVTIVSNHSTYTIENVQHSDAGLYKCIAKNSLGNDSDSGNLIVAVTTTRKRVVRPSGAVTAGIVTGVTALGGIVIVFIYCCKPKIVKRKTVSPSGSDRAAVNLQELSEHEQHDGEGDNIQDTANCSEASESESSPPEDTSTLVYVSFENSNREGKLAE